VLALAVNADTLRVARDLYQNPVVRAAFAERAQQVGGQTTALSDDQVKTLVSGLPLPLGWPGDWPGKDDELMWFIIVKVVGVLLTVAAISLGAPFWFDLLNQVVNLRAAGAAPAPSRAASATTVPTTAEAKT
jgi:hypothetical protein